MGPKDFSVLFSSKTQKSFTLPRNYYSTENYSQTYLVRFPTIFHSILILRLLLYSNLILDFKTLLAGPIRIDVSLKQVFLNVS